MVIAHGVKGKLYSIATLYANAVSTRTIRPATVNRIPSAMGNQYRYEPSAMVEDFDTRSLNTLGRGCGNDEADKEYK